MGRKFDVEYDDFSGGYYVGQSDAKQPMNTWKGDDIALTPDDGFLVPVPTQVTSASIGTVQFRRMFEGPNMTTFIAPRVSGNNAQSVVWPIGSFATPSTVVTGIGSPSDVGAQFDKYAFWPVTGATNIIYYDFSTGTGGLQAVPAIFNVVGSYKAWAVGSVGVGSFTNPNRLYYSAPLDLLSWPASNYYDIGSNNAAITALVDALDALYIGTTVGWFVLTGVLGSTATVRQLTTSPVYNEARVVPGVNMILAPAYSSGTVAPPESLVGLAGSQEVALLPKANNSVSDVIVEVAPNGPATVFRCTSGRMWVYDPIRRLGWRTCTFATSLPTPRLVFSQSGTSSGAGYGTVHSWTGTNSLMYRYKIQYEEPEVNVTSGDFPVASVSLADYRAKSKFIVKKVVLELDLGLTAVNKQRSVAVKVNAPGVLLNGGLTVAGNSANASTTQTRILPALASTNRERVWLEFNVNDAGETYAMEPVITLQGVKLCRAIVQCEEV